MPSSLIHNSATIATTTAMSLIGLTVLPPDQVTALTLGGLSGLLLTPDLDQAEARVNQLGLAGAVKSPVKVGWFGWWYPYGKVIKHRSMWSHWPILGTLIRQVYFPIVPISLAVGVVSPLQALAYWTGLSVVDAVHWLLDEIDKLVGGAL